MGRALPSSLSPSKITSFRDCPLAFRFSVIDRIPEPPSPWASKGTLVHRALELLMLRPPEQRTLTEAWADLARARTELADDPEFTGLELTDDDLAAFHADAERMVERYFELEDPATIRPIGLEVMLSARLGGLLLRGIIDRLELDDDGELVVTDYKTGKAPREGFEQARLTGLQFYALLCEEVLGQRPAKVQLLYLSTPESIAATPTESMTRGIRQRSQAVWQAVERACTLDDFRPRTGPLCGYCTFKPYCPSFGGDPELAVELRDGLVQERLPVLGT